MSINFNIRMDESLKERAFPIIESYGLTPAMAIKLFLNQIADTRALPLSFNYKAEEKPNAITAKALEEALAERENPTATSYTLEEAIKTMQEIVGE